MCTYALALRCGCGEGCAGVHLTSACDLAKLTEPVFENITRGRLKKALAIGLDIQNGGLPALEPLLLTQVMSPSSTGLQVVIRSTAFVKRLK